MVLPFAPLIGHVDFRKDYRVAILGKLIAECSNVHNAITWLLEHRVWDCAAVYYDAIDHFGHGFMAYHPPKMPRGRATEDFEVYQHVVTAAYRFHDMMLGRLLELAGEDTTVILISDHGFRSGALRPRVEPTFMGAGAVWHRYHGVFAMKGPHVRKDEWLHDLSILDVTPTLLTLLGLPVGDDMDGKPLVQAFDELVGRLEVARIPSWEEVPGACGRHPPERQDRPFDNLVALQQLIALGYIQPLDKPLQDTLEQHGHEAQIRACQRLLRCGHVSGGAAAAGGSNPGRPAGHPLSPAPGAVLPGARALRCGARGLLRTSCQRGDEHHASARTIWPPARTMRPSAICSWPDGTRRRARNPCPGCGSASAGSATSSAAGRRRWPPTTRR